MFFAGLIIFIACTLYLPWYAASIMALLIGFFIRFATLRQHLVLAASAGLANGACAFMADGRNYGLVSKRMSGLFSLPTPGLIFVTLFVMSFLSVFLWLRGGSVLRRLAGK